MSGRFPFLSDLLPESEPASVRKTGLHLAGLAQPDEAIGDGVGAGNPGTGPVTFTGSRTFTSAAIPEPSSLALMVIGGGFVAASRRRR